MGVRSDSDKEGSSLRNLPLVGGPIDYISRGAVKLFKRITGKEAEEYQAIIEEINEERDEARRFERIAIEERDEERARAEELEARLGYSSELGVRTKLVGVTGQYRDLFGRDIDRAEALLIDHVTSGEKVREDHLRQLVKLGIFTPALRTEGATLVMPPEYQNVFGELEIVKIAPREVISLEAGVNAAMRELRDKLSEHEWRMAEYGLEGVLPRIRIMPMRTGKRTLRQQMAVNEEGKVVSLYEVLLNPKLDPNQRRNYIEGVLQELAIAQVWMTERQTYLLREAGHSAEDKIFSANLQEALIPNLDELNYSGKVSKIEFALGALDAGVLDTAFLDYFLANLMVVPEGFVKIDGEKSHIRTTIFDDAIHVVEALGGFRGEPRIELYNYFLLQREAAVRILSEDYEGAAQVYRAIETGELGNKDIKGFVPLEKQALYRDVRHRTRVVRHWSYLNYLFRTVKPPMIDQQIHDEMVAHHYLEAQQAIGRLYEISRRATLPNIEEIGAYATLNELMSGAKHGLDLGPQAILRGMKNVLTLMRS